MEFWWVVLQGRGEFPHLLPSAPAVKFQPAGGLWALVSPFRSLPAHRAVLHTSPSPHPFPPTCHQDVGGKMSPRLLRRATLHLPLSWSLPNSVPHPETFLTPLLVPASGVSPSGRPAHPSYSSLNLLSLGRSPACLWLVCWGSLHPGALWTSSACMQGHAGKANVGTWCWSEG